MHLNVWDWAVVAVYAVVIVTIGLRAGRKQHTSEGYFLAGRRLRWPFIGASIYAANISTEHFVGLAGRRLRHGAGLRLLRMDRRLLPDSA